MPKIEDLERLGSIAFLMGKKKLPKELSKNDYDSLSRFSQTNIWKVQNSPKITICQIWTK